MRRLVHTSCFALSVLVLDSWLVNSLERGGGLFYTASNAFRTFIVQFKVAVSSQCESIRIDRHRGSVIIFCLKNS